MNDWLDYQGSGSSRAYIAHSKLFGKNDEQTKADLRLLDAYAAKAYKLKNEYVTLLNNYNTSLMMYNRYRRDAESQESKRAEVAKSGRPLKATQDYESNIWRSKKDAANAKSEANSYLVQMKANIDAQKKLQADANELKVNMKKDTTRSLTTYDPKTIFIPDELPSNINQRIKQSYFDMPADKSIMHTEKGGISMNDWLDYQGSGSSRAYTNDTLSHAAPVKNTTSNGYNYLNSRLSELTKQEDELVALAGEAANLMNTGYGKLRTAYGKIQVIDKKMAAMDKAGWDITESINRGNFSAMQKEALTNKLNSIGKRGQAKLAAMYVPIDTIDDIRSSLRSALSNFTVVGHSYSGIPADEYIEHGRFRDNINDTIGKVMDKVTNADHRTSDARSKQKEADERLKQAQIERVSKEIRDAADKLQRDAADVQWESFNYLTKLDKAWDPLVAKMKNTTDPKALAQLDSAYRNLSNDVIRMNDKISEKVSTLYDEYYRIRNRYDDFVYNYPTAYVSSVPRLLQDAIKNLDKANKATHTFITYSNREIWK